MDFQSEWSLLLFLLLFSFHLKHGPAAGWASSWLPAASQSRAGRQGWELWACRGLLCSAPPGSLCHRQRFAISPSQFWDKRVISVCLIFPELSGKRRKKVMLERHCSSIIQRSRSLGLQKGKKKKHQTHYNNNPKQNPQTFKHVVISGSFCYIKKGESKVLIVLDFWRFCTLFMDEKDFLQGSLLAGF